MSDSEYSKALTTCAAALAIKIGIVHMLTVRERLMTDQYVNTWDGKNAGGSFFKLTMGCVQGTGMGGEAFIARTERLAKGCAENEPIFLILASVSPPSAIGLTCIQAFTAGRMAHSLMYLLGDKFNTFFRSSFYLVGLSSTLVLAGVALTQN